MSDISKEFMSRHRAGQKAEEWENFKGDFEVRKTALTLALDLNDIGVADEDESRQEHIDVILDYAAAFERYLRIGKAPH